MRVRRARLKAEKSLPKFLAVDFFCGAGGTTRGLIDAGGYVVAGVDKDVRCEITFSKNNVNTTLDCAPANFLNYDIFPRSESYPNGQRHELTHSLERLIPYYRKKAPRIPLLFAICAPCQPFTSLLQRKMSLARKIGRKRDSNLLNKAISFVRRFAPELVLSENVAGIGDPRFGGVWDDFRLALERAGYATGTNIICTSNFGIPQFRKRSILLAVRRSIVKSDRYVDGKLGELLVPANDPGSCEVTVAQAIKHLPALTAGATHPRIPNHKTRSLSDLNLKRIASAKPGQSNAYLHNTTYGDLSLDCHRKVNKRLGGRCFNDVYTRMHPSRPSPTITTKCHSISNGRFGHYDTKQNRGISLREAAILQTFPDDYVFYPTEQIDPIARMIGNAVPPKLARYFATYLLNSIDS